MTSYPSRLAVRTGAPAVEPVSLAEAKLYLRVEHSADDDLITDIIFAARNAAEKYTRKSFITQIWKLAFDDNVSADVAIPYGPVQSITSVTSIARDGTTTEVDDAIYFLNTAKDTLCFDQEVTGHQVEIVYLSGYGDATAVPADIKQALLMHIASLYDLREIGGGMPVNAIAFLQPYRELRV